jgi:hypothetical protein
VVETAKPSLKSKPKPNAGTARRQLDAQQQPAAPADSGGYRPLGLDYPSNLPELTSAQKQEFEAKLAQVPPYLRGTMMVYIVHSIAPESFKPGVLLAPNPTAR